MNTIHAFVCMWKRNFFLVIRLVNAIDERLCFLIKSATSPEASFKGSAKICRMKIFGYIDAAWIEQRKKNLEAFPLMTCDMAAVIDDNVDATHFLNHGFQKFRVCL